MREILFRGKRKDNGKWVEGHYGEYYSGKENVSCISIPKETISGSLCYEVILKTVGQYTGLTDKNGLTKIFEGDILCVEQRRETGSRICPVYFGEYIDADSVFDDYRCIGFYVKTSDGCCNIGALLSEEFEFEVIGNVFDSPELLEGDKT